MVRKSRTSSARTTTPAASRRVSSSGSLRLQGPWPPRHRGQRDRQLAPSTLAGHPEPYSWAVNPAPRAGVRPGTSLRRPLSTSVFRVSCSASSFVSRRPSGRRTSSTSRSTSSMLASGGTTYLRGSITARSLPAGSTPRSLGPDIREKRHDLTRLRSGQLSIFCRAAALAGQPSRNTQEPVVVVIAPDPPVR